MKKVLIMAAVAVIVIAMAGTALAVPVDASLAATNVSATVAGKCTIIAQDAALAFGELDLETGTATEAATLSGSATVKCTKNHPFTVKAASTYNGAAAADCTVGIPGTLSIDGATKTHTMNYTFTCAAGTGNGFGSGAAVSLSPAATIDMTANANKDAWVGSYTDIITMTITY